MWVGAGDVDLSCGDVGETGAEGDSSSGSWLPSESAGGDCDGIISAAVNLGGKLASGWKPSSADGLGVLNLLGATSSTTDARPTFHPRGVAVFVLRILLDFDLPLSLAPLATGSPAG